MTSFECYIVITLLTVSLKPLTCKSAVWDGCYPIKTQIPNKVKLHFYKQPVNLYIYMYYTFYLPYFAVYKSTPCISRPRV